MRGNGSGAMRVGYFGPEGTYTHEALLGSLAGVLGVQEVALGSIHEVVMAVADGRVQRGIVPIENAIEGSVNATLDAVRETDTVAIVGEYVLPIHHCLIARQALTPADIEVVISHPQAIAQCARFLRDQVSQARVVVGASTADAVRTVAETDAPWAALAGRVAAERYGCRVLEAGVEDEPDNETRFVWLARAGEDERGGDDGPFKTAIVFWPRTHDAPGWLVACLAEFGDRGVNLTRIESRPRRRGLGSYMFFVDLDGGVGEPVVDEALAGVRRHCEVLRVLGSFPVAQRGP